MKRTLSPSSPAVASLATALLASTLLATSTWAAPGPDEIFQELADDIDDMPELQLGNVTALSSLGNVMLELEESPDEAEQKLLESLAVFERLNAADRNSESALKAQSNALNGLAKIARNRKKAEEALEYFEKSTAVRQKWTELYPDSLEAKRKLANAG